MQLSQASLQQAETILERASQDICQITAQIVQKNLVEPIQDLEKQSKKIGENLQYHADYAQKKHLHTLKTLKGLIWCAIAAFVLAAIVCIVSIMFIFQNSKQQMRRAEWVEDINHAVAKGVLSQCQIVHETVKSGLCVKIKGKWIPI